MGTLNSSRDTVSRLLFNVPIEYYLVLDVNGVGALADAVGGVEVVALQDVPKTDMREGQPYVLKGEQARQYVVERDEAPWTAWSGRSSSCGPSPAGSSTR